MTDEAKTDALVPVVGSGTLTSSSANQFLERASGYAMALKGVIDKQKLYAIIKGKKFVTIEGWCTLSAMMGITPHEIDTSGDIEGCYESVIELRNADGVAIARASAECGGPNEPMWNGRVANSRRSMAQTRATAKACRLAFSWIMTMAGYSVTPAEEMQAALEGDQRPAPSNEKPPPDPETETEAQKGSPNCPNCGRGLRRSKYPDKEDGDLGWYCWKKKEGCGNEYKSYQVGEGSVDYSQGPDVGVNEVLESEVVDDEPPLPESENPGLF